MCGVFGFMSREGGRVNLQALARVAEVTQRRGPHAFGFAWIDRRGRLKCYKQTGRITDHLGLLAMAADARMLIGHCRWATQGNPLHLGATAQGFYLASLADGLPGKVEAVEDGTASLFTSRGVCHAEV